MEYPEEDHGSAIPLYISKHRKCNETMQKQKEKKKYRETLIYNLYIWLIVIFMQREYRQDIVQPDSYPPLILHLPTPPPLFLWKILDPRLLMSLLDLLSSGSAKKEYKRLIYFWKGDFTPLYLDLLLRSGAPFCLNFQRICIRVTHSYIFILTFLFYQLSFLSYS